MEEDAKSTLLIVDDTEINLQILVRSLEDDYDIAAATDGASALEFIEHEIPDLILLDIMMPDMDGYEVCSILKSNPRTAQVPIIFITALSEIKAKSRGFELGAVDYITKPFEILEVKARVQTHVQMQRNIKELKEANTAIEAQRKRIQLELDLGRRIQNNMLPTVFPERPEFEISAFLKPAKELGGDFYDFFYIDDENICISVGDVSGKGVPAALFMAVSKTLIKSVASPSHSPSQILSEVNNELSLDNDSVMFVSLFIGIFNIPTATITYSNGGHTPPYILKSEGETVPLDNKHGMVLGFAGDAVYLEDTYVFEKDDSILLYSDGITEATNEAGEFYNESGLVNSLPLPSASAGDTLQVILSELDEFVSGSEQADDITVLILKYLGATLGYEGDNI